jgi:four helix bundle protein
MSGRFQGDLPERTFMFAVRIVTLIDCLPNNAKGWVVGKQLLRSGTSIGANVHEANEALTDAEFASKCSVARKESSETRYWLRLCQHCNLLPHDCVEREINEANELASVLSSIVRKTQLHLAKR